MNAAARAAGVMFVASALIASLPRSIDAQARPAGTPIARALDAERRGSYADAVALFGAVLDTRPDDGAALTGLERALTATGRIAELAPRLSRALDIDSTNIGFLGLAVRTFASIGQPDSAARYAERWARLEPGEEGPYREWAITAIEGRDQASARRALETGRRRLTRPGVLAPELAQVLQLAGDWGGAAREWLLAVDAASGYRMAAVTSLTRAAGAQRTAVRAVLEGAASMEGARVLGLLLTRWGDPEAGATAVLAALPTEPEPAIALLRALIDEGRGRDGVVNLRVRARLLEAVATRQAGAAAVRTRMDAARAFADAGDERNARRLLAVVASDPQAPAGMATTASSTLLGVLLAEGKADEAARVLAELSPSLDADERERQTRRVAMAYARAQRFARADSVIALDSSVAGFDLRGRIRLLQGDLAAATEFLKLAGPYDDEREHAVERVTLLALLQAVGRDSLAALGQAMLALERSDTATAITGLETIAATLEEGGAAEMRLLAGRLALSRADTAAAGRLLRGANVAERPATAAAARLSLARLEVLAGRTAAAMTMLESLILEFPESSVVPEARRMRDAIAGTIPGAR